MWELDIPGLGNLVLEHLVLDLNGTLALDGRPAPGVAEALSELAARLELHLVTADTFGTARSLFAGVEPALFIISAGGEDHQKLELVQRLGPSQTCAMGNGANDALMLEAAAVGICVMGDEGAHPGALAAADVVVPSARAGLELLLRPGRLKATLRR